MFLSRGSGQLDNSWMWLKFRYSSYESRALGCIRWDKLAGEQWRILIPFLSREAECKLFECTRGNPGFVEYSRYHRGISRYWKKNWWSRPRSALKTYVQFVIRWKCRWGNMYPFVSQTHCRLMKQLVAWQFFFKFYFVLSAFATVDNQYSELHIAVIRYFSGTHEEHRDIFNKRP